MFPKAHAAAYIMMVPEYAKVYHPLAYYAAYFGIRAKAFNYEIMSGSEKLNYYVRTIKEEKKRVNYQKR